MNNTEALEDKFSVVIAVFHYVNKNRQETEGGHSIARRIAIEERVQDSNNKEVDLVVTHMENNVLNGKILQTTDEKTVIDHIYCMNTMGNMDELDILSKGKNITVYDVLDYVEGDTLVPIIVDGDEIAKYKKHAL